MTEPVVCGSLRGRAGPVHAKNFACGLVSPAFIRGSKSWDGARPALTRIDPQPLLFQEPHAALEQQPCCPREGHDAAAMRSRPSIIAISMNAGRFRNHHSLRRALIRDDRVKSTAIGRRGRRCRIARGDPDRIAVDGGQ